jgi:hypothetical protein
MKLEQVQLAKNDVPEGWSYEAADFINKVIFKQGLSVYS